MIKRSRAVDQTNRPSQEPKVCFGNQRVRPQVIDSKLLRIELSPLHFLGLGFAKRDLLLLVAAQLNQRSSSPFNPKNRSYKQKLVTMLPTMTTNLCRLE